MTPAPAVQFQLPLATNRNSAAAFKTPQIQISDRREQSGKSPRQIPVFISRVTKNETTRSARPSTGELSDAKTRRFWESQRTNDEKIDCPAAEVVPLGVRRLVGNPAEQRNQAAQGEPPQPFRSFK